MCAFCLLANAHVSFSLQAKNALTVEDESNQRGIPSVPKFGYLVIINTLRKECVHTCIHKSLTDKDFW